MVDADEQEITPGLAAFLCAFIGGGFITAGLLTSIIFSPAALLLFALGVLLLFGAPVVWFLVSRGQKVQSE